MPITPTNPFKGRHFPGDLILLCVRWYLRYPLAYQHVAELLADRGVEVDPSCIWRWVQAYAPELNKRCRPHLKPSRKSYRTDETYIKVKGEDKYPVSCGGFKWPDDRVSAHGQARCSRRQTLLPQGAELSWQSRAAGHQRGQEPGFSSSCGSLEGGRDSASTSPSASMQVPEQCGGTGSSDS